MDDGLLGTETAQYEPQGRPIINDQVCNPKLHAIFF